MITGQGPLMDVLAFLAIGWAGSILLLPFAQWIDYKQDCRKRGRKVADEILRRMR